MMKEAQNLWLIQGSQASYVTKIFPNVTTYNQMYEYTISVFMQLIKNFCSEHAYAVGHQVLPLMFNFGDSKSKQCSVDAFG